MIRANKFSALYHAARQKESEILSLEVAKRRRTSYMYCRYVYAAADEVRIASQQRRSDHVCAGILILVHLRCHEYPLM